MFKDKKIDRLYHTWKSILNRTCDNYKNDRHYKTYKEKNIKICDEWLVWENFKKWALENGYDYIPYPSGRNKITIDRIDNNGDYEPSNCRWVTHEENQYNKSNTIYIEYKGNRYNIKELSEITNLPKTTIIARIKRKTDLNKPYLEKKEYYFEINGKIKSLTDLAKENNLSRKLLYNRIFNLKWSVDEAVSFGILKISKNVKLYKYNGEEYTITNLAKKLNINRTTLQYRIKHNLNYDGTKKENTK